MWDDGWNRLFSRKSWGMYPPEELLRFVGKNFCTISDRKKIKFLEVGCGPGANLWYLAREGFTAIGIDGSDIALSQAEKRFNSENLTVELHHGDILKLPFENETFDCVLDIECIYANSFDDSKKIMSQIHRVLKYDGIFFSKMFATGITGEETAKPISGERNTYSEMPDSPLNSDYGLVRLIDESDIASLLQDFHNIQYDYVIRSIAQRQQVLKEWIIQCQK